MTAFSWELGNQSHEIKQEIELEMFKNHHSGTDISF